MPSLKALRMRINSVKSTQKITSAMKMVAASKLRRAQQQAEAARPYAQRMERMLGALAAAIAGSPSAPPLLVGTGKDQVHLLIPVTADRGLTGDITYAGKKRIGFADAEEIAVRVTAMLTAGEIDVCTLIYNRFQSVISQVVTEQQLIPAPAPPGQEEATAALGGATYEFEPDEDTILARLLPQALAIQLYRALLESAAGEHGARMSAMDNATRNAGDMIKRLTLNYNRARQANITRELIEIISGAEAL